MPIYGNQTKHQQQQSNKERLLHTTKGNSPYQINEWKWIAEWLLCLQNFLCLERKKILKNKGNYFVPKWWIRDLHIALVFSKAEPEARAWAEGVSLGTGPRRRWGDETGREGGKTKIRIPYGGQGCRQVGIPLGWSQKSVGCFQDHLLKNRMLGHLSMRTPLLALCFHVCHHL